MVITKNNSAKLICEKNTRTCWEGDVFQKCASMALFGLNSETKSTQGKGEELLHFPNIDPVTWKMRDKCGVSL